MMSVGEIASVLANIKYKHGYELICAPVSDAPGTTHWYLQVIATIPFPPPLRGSRIMKGGKHLLSPHMTASELVQCAFKAFLAFEEHECREHFTYKGQLVLGPHNDLDKVAELLALGELKESVRS